MKKYASALVRYLGGGSVSLFLGNWGIIAIVCMARMLGILEGVELQTLDLFLRRRPFETPDERITILEITDADIQDLGTYPVPDDAITQLLTQLKTYQPRVIGLDIFRDLPVINPRQTNIEVSKQSNQAFITLIQNSPDIVVIEKILDPPVSAPPGVSEDNIGFVDTLLDEDGFTRRSLLASASSANPDDYHLSFTIQLASKYLLPEGYELSNGIQDMNAMRFGHTELFRMRSNSGGYSDQDTGENPVMLINFRNGYRPFRRLSLKQFREGNFPEEWITDKIVLIGMTAASTKDYINSAAIASENPGLVAGVELQAHAISQIVSAVLDDRPVLKTWSMQWEYLWILMMGVLGISLAHLKKNLPLLIALYFLLGSLPIILTYQFLLAGVWIPFFPAWLVYSLSGGSTVLYRVYQREQSLKIRFDERRRVLEQSYNAIHNGPLQTLKGLIRRTASKTETSQTERLSSQRLNQELSKVDEELRNIYEFMQREYLQRDYAPNTSIYLTKNYVIDLTDPLHELLHQVYQNKLQESYQYFETIKIKIPDFCPMDASALDLAHKEDIIRFLEEALCNIEQHATGVGKLTITCKQDAGHNIIRVTDNGQGVTSARLENRIGNGTRQAKLLARRLNGHFSRRSQRPSGLVCELIWPVQAQSPWKSWLREVQTSAMSFALKRPQG